MRDLLYAGLARLRKNRVFWLAVILLALVAVGGVVTKYSDMVRYDLQETFESAAFVYAVFGGCASAVFCGLFTGTEYSDGALRNKLIVGHSRRAVYLAQWSVSVVAALGMALAYLAAYCLLGLPLLGAPQMSVGKLLTLVAVSLCTITAYTSLFHLVAMLQTHKSSAAVLCILLFLGLLVCGLVVQGMLEAPEFVTEYELTVNGASASEPRPNPKYLYGTVRAVWQFIHDLLPGGQSLQLSMANAAHPLTIALCAVGVSLLSCVGGVLAFENKDLR